MSLEIKGCQQLRTEVIDRDLCALCGACVGMCPYLVAYKGRVVALDDCNMAAGRCYAFCPRTSTDLDAASEAALGSLFDSSPIGRVREVMITRATREDVRFRGQYGGTVTVLTAFALERGLIDSAVVTSTDGRLLPEGILVGEASHIVNYARSNYVAAPTVSAFNREARDPSRSSIGIVGTPCQALALAKMRASPLENRNNVEKLSLVIGLFCTWALRYQEFAGYLGSKVDLTAVSKFDIPPPPANIFQVYQDSKVESFPLDEVRGFIRPACTMCLDMTAEFADISVGAAEGIDGWNTLIVRSDRGAELLAAARSEGILEVDSLPDESLDHLKGASLGKRRRALANIVATSGSEDDLMYLQPNADIRARLLGE